MENPTGESPASHEGVDVPVTLNVPVSLRQRFDVLLRDYKALAAPGRREYDQLLDDVILAARESVAAQLKDHVHMETIL